MINIKILSTKEEIEDASALLYKVHIEQAQWKFLPDNPSRISIKIKDNRKLLIDRFSDSAIWFGAFDNLQLVGCTRLCGIDKNNKIEMEGYPSSIVIQKYLPKDKGSYIESTRTAIAQSHTGSGIAKQLLLTAFKYCEKNKYSLAATVSNIYLKSFLKRIGFPLKLEHAFKYEPQDPLPVNFYFADYNKLEVKHMISALENLENQVGFNETKILKALEIVAPILPTPIYWHDKKGVVLGLNEHCLKGMGATRDIIGKTPYAFYPKEIATHILQHNEQVMRSGEVLSQDERIEDVTTGQTKIFRNIKAPLYDDEGNIIGIIGSAIDVTFEKEFQQLKRQMIEHQKELKVREVFKKCIDEIQHIMQSNKIDTLNDKLGIKSQNNQLQDLSDIKLTKREIEVLYFLSLSKSPKEIAAIVEILEEKSISPATIQSIIDKQLYPKFNVYNISQLIEKANILNLIPFLPDSINH